MLMKKISTLALMAFFCCLGAMAQVQLGNISFSLGEGKKISPTTGKITVTFPDVTGVEDPTTTNFVVAGNFGNEDTAFDGLEGTFATGITFDLLEFGLEPSTDYTLNITSVQVDGQELAAEGGYSLNFRTRSAERKMAWTFTIDEESSAQIVAEGTGNTEDLTKYVEVGKARWYVPARNYEEILLPDGTALPMTEDLLFKFGSKVFYVGDVSGSYKDRICFNGNNQYMTIPDCNVGDVITFNATRATSYKAGSKYTLIVAQNGAAIAPEGFVSESGVQDSIQLAGNSNFANYKFEVQTAGDVTFKFSNCHLKSISIEEGQEKLPRNYTIVAGYTDGENTISIKELVGVTEGITGSSIKAYYPYWVVDADGNVYTHGSKGNEFSEVLDLKNGVGDTTFVINYKKTDFEGAVFLSEGEDLPEAILCTSANATVRSSMGKAGYVLEDTKLATLEPGTYKIRAILFDAGKEPTYVCKLTKGEGEENEINLYANATNWTEAESDLLTITEATDITLKAGGGDNYGLDTILIYASEDAPEDPEGIYDVENGAQKNAVRKVMKNGQILIETAAGTFNAVGVQVK